jgi:hypothetical protein
LRESGCRSAAGGRALDEALVHEPGSAAHIEVDDGEAGAIDSASTDLPSFLTDDEPVAAALNGASTP